MLPYPEGTACADVLVAGERGGKLAAMVFGGLGIGALWKSLSWIFNLFLHRDRLLDAAQQPVPERDAERRRLARIHGRRLRHRPAHRGDDVRRRRAVVARAAAAAVDSRRVHPRAVSADSSQLREQPGDRHAVPDLGDGRRAALERVHPLHRRRRRAGGRPHHARPHAADDRRVGARRPEGFRRGRRHGDPPAHRARHPDDRRPRRLAAARRSSSRSRRRCRRRATSWRRSSSSSSDSCSSPCRRASPASSAPRRTRSPA